MAWGSQEAAAAGDGAGDGSLLDFFGHEHLVLKSCSETALL